MGLLTPGDKSKGSERDKITSSLVVKWLVYPPVAAVVALGLQSLTPSTLADSINGGERTPSPMLWICGLPLAQLQHHVDITNTLPPARGWKFSNFSNQ